MHANKHSHTIRVSLTAAAVAGMTLGLILPNAVHAQSTTGAVFGQAPAGMTVSVNGPGPRHHVVVPDNGRYQIARLPLGLYTITLSNGDKTVDARKNVPLTVGRGSEVDFACPQDRCAKE